MVFRVLVSLKKNEFTPGVFQNSQVFLFGQRTVIEILAAHVAGYLAIYAACGKQDYAAFRKGAAQFLGQAALRGVRRVKDAVPGDDGIVLFRNPPLANISMYKARTRMALSCQL